MAADRPPDLELDMKRPSIHDTASLFRNQLFRRLWVAQFGTVIAVYALNMAGITLVEQRTGSTFQTSVAIVTSILPALLGSLVAGAVVDRFGQVRVLKVSHLSRALIGVGFWASTTWLRPEWAVNCVFAANAAWAIFSQFAVSAEQALLPNYVPKESLMGANALFQLSMLGGEGLGVVVLTPLLIALAGIPVVGLAGAALSLVALILVLGLPRVAVPAGDRAVRHNRWAEWKADLKAGWQVIFNDHVLALVVVEATLGASVMLIFLSLMPAIISHFLGMELAQAAFVILPGGLGFFAGSVLVSRYDNRLPRQVWISLGLLGLGASVGLLGLVLGVWEGAALGAILGLMLVGGVSLALVIIPSRAVLQERPPERVRGRVISAQLALANAAAVLPILLGGALAEQLGIPSLVGAVGLVALGTGAMGLFQTRA
jgi:DHA3 family macrolide efflux protein-like MFS transporter